MSVCVVAIEKGAFWSPSTKVANFIDLESQLTALGDSQVVST